MPRQSKNLAAILPAAKTEIDWGGIFTALGKWRKKIPDSAVEHIAEKFPRSPWAILVSTLLSLRTKDEVTIKTSLAVLTTAPSPRDYLKLTPARAEQLAFPAGFYRVKSAQLRKIAEILLARYQGEVPAAQSALLDLPGIGLKAANLILAVAFAQNYICVDTHVHRIANRLGWLKTTKPEQTEAGLRRILPRRYWQNINSLLVLYGQRICAPISPHCSRCVIGNYCARDGVNKQR